MMFDIPLDLVEEILSRVPATSFKRLRSTCRRWNALLKDPRFTEKHSRKAPKESMVLMLKEYRVCPISINLNVAPPSIEFQGAVGLKDSHSNLEQVKITEVFHCNGLLLCTTKGNRLVVWNPCLGETKWIQLKVDYGRNGSSFALGYIQNNESCRSYKILWSWYSYDYKSSPPQIVLGFEIYEFSSDSWKVLDDVNHDSLLNHNSIIGTGVSLKGNTYLLASDLKERSNFLLMFDFTTEKLKRLCLPHFQDVVNLDLSVVREEQLAVLNWSRTTSKMEIWITNNIDTESTLLWRLHLDTRCNCVRIFSSLLIDEEEKKVVLCCNVNDDETSKNMVYIIGEDDGYYIEIPFVESTNIQRVLLIRNKKWYSSIFSYVPSLFQIQ